MTTVVDAAVRDRAARRLGRAGARLPTFAELADPSRIPEARFARCAAPIRTGPIRPTCFASTGTTTTPARGFAATPELSRAAARADRRQRAILVALGCNFPMIGAHKVLAAYGCLVPRLVTGQFDPTRHKAVWPSTGNYCRGGVAISRILGCRGVAVLPAGMSRGALRVARAIGSPSPRTSSARPAPRATSRRSTTNAPSSRAIPRTSSSISSPSSAITWPTTSAPARRCARVFEDARRRDPGLRLAAFVAAIRLGRDAGRRRLPERASSAPRSSRSRRANARHCSITAMASTTSRASATSTSPTSTT